MNFVTALDFSQFYLPQCCYIPPTPAPAASFNNPTFRHDIQARKTESPQMINIEHNSQTVNQSTDSTTKSETTRKRKITARLFRYIIPLEDEESQESTEAIEEPSNEKMFSKKMWKTLRNDVRAPLNERPKKTTLLSSAQTEPELLPENTTSDMNSSNSTFASRGVLSMNETLESMLKFKRNINTGSSGSNDTQEEYRQMSEKFPVNWMINLRRALYQSIDTMINKRSKKTKADETLQAKSSNHNPQRSSEEETNRITDLWHHLRLANLSLVEPLTRAASTLPENLYLPQGEGPIASGVVVNTLSGIQLRMASELYFQQDAPNSVISNNGCNCHLINNGDIPMAYWSVSRIYNEDGNPALQYLIYPLPHNVPTPPRMIPFNQQTFSPSPHNSNFNLVQQYSNLQQGQLGHSHITQVAGGYVPDYEQLPPHLQEVPLDTSHPENIKQISRPAKFDEANRNLQYFTRIPQTGTNGDRTGYRGIPIQNQYGYTPEFLQLYKHAVVNHLNQKEYHNSQLHQLRPQKDPSTTASFPNQLQPGVVANNKQTVPPAHLQLFDGKAPEFPKSIQDILTPGNAFLPGAITMPNQISGFADQAEPEGGLHQGIPQHEILQQGNDGGYSNPNLSPGTGVQQYHGTVNLGMNHQSHDSSYAERPSKFNIGNFYSFQDPTKGQGPQLSDYPIYPDDYVVPQHHQSNSHSQPPQHHEHLSHPQPPQHDHDLSHPQPLQHDHDLSHPQPLQHHPHLTHATPPQHHHGLSHAQNPEHIYNTHGSHPDNKHYHDHDRPPITHHRPHQSTYRGSYNDETIRYHRSQQSPTRHRSEKYSRSTERIVNPVGTYIINF
ncbi:unnamed protein product [Allacma fusca]|uniref:Uncharacterized protein n=1 Tax=Allacma fusca TaxID=39272 RepID=A0A8J2JCB3_9HEXA|nr:unnamed protein product [Allacma fusca]